MAQDDNDKTTPKEKKQCSISIGEERGGRGERRERRRRERRDREEEQAAKISRPNGPGPVESGVGLLYFPFTGPTGPVVFLADIF